MAYLIDSGIVLRLVDTKDAKHTEVLQSVRILGDIGEELFLSTQNIAEYCNVATRPIPNNGLGLQPSEAIRLFEKDVEPICQVVFEREAVPQELKRLVSAYSVTGKQVHDARLVAIMLAWQIDNILTLNDRDFRRYEPEGIKIVTPAELIASQ
jgi:predicted nucleic acid-binding protein